MYFEEEISLNSVIEVLGVISLTSADLANQDERGEFQPPSNIIPRIHCIVANKWIHNNPNMSQVQGLFWEAGTIPKCFEIKKKISYFFSLLDLANAAANFPKVRDELHGLFTEILAGDSLAADYLLCHLASHV